MFVLVWTNGNINPTALITDAAERGYQGLCWIMNRPEKSILMVSHGGILRYMMNIHPLIKIQDGRKKVDGNSDDDLKDVQSRFDNCEVRGYDLCWSDDNDSCPSTNNDDMEKATEVAERTRRNIFEASISVEAQILKITVSIGVATHNVDDQTIDSVLQSADQALYKAKSQGRNQVIANMCEK